MTHKKEMMSLKTMLLLLFTVKYPEGEEPFISSMPARRSDL